MTLTEAKQLSFPQSWTEPAKTRLFLYGPWAQKQYDNICFWTRLGDGDIRWRCHYLEQIEWPISEP